MLSGRSGKCRKEEGSTARPSRASGFAGSEGAGDSGPTGRPVRSSPGPNSSEEGQEGRRPGDPIVPGDRPAEGAKSSARAFSRMSASSAARMSACSRAIPGSRIRRRLCISARGVVSLHTVGYPGLEGRAVFPSSLRHVLLLPDSNSCP